MHMFDSQAKLGVILIFYKICVLVNFYKLQSTFVIDGLRLRYLRDHIGVAPIMQLLTCIIKIVTFKEGQLVW